MLSRRTPFDEDVARLKQFRILLPTFCHAPGFEHGMVYFHDVGIPPAPSDDFVFLLLFGYDIAPAMLPFPNRKDAVFQPDLLL